MLFWLYVRTTLLGIALGIVLIYLYKTTVSAFEIVEMIHDLDDFSGIHFAELDMF